MTTVTERAAPGLEEILVTSNAPSGQGVKLVPRGTGTVSMIIGAPSEGDEAIRRGEPPLPIFDSSLAAALDGWEIDCDTARVNSQLMMQFQLRRPA